MRANFLHIQQLAGQAMQANGDFIELGVWWGTTFIPLAEMCRQNDRHIHAVDSWQGMATPTKLDGPSRYREGDLSTQGSAVFRQLAKPFKNVHIHEGWIPEVLDQLNGATYAFAHVDLDQYKPMIHAMEHVWQRMSPGGIMVCHDWIPSRDILATQAIRDFMARYKIDLTGQSGVTNHAWFIK